MDKPELRQRKKAKTKGRQPCTFDGCDRFNFAHGLCQAHAAQKRRGVELRPVRAPRPDAAEGYHWCSHCKQSRPEEDFGWDKVRDQLKRVCLECNKALQQAYVDRAGQANINQRQRLRKRGITQEEFDVLMARQESRCAICRRDDRPLDIDHCHENGHVRGLLCGPCNRGIGFLEDNIGILRAAISYLEKGTV